MTQLVLDLFSRTVSSNSSGWGNCSDGVSSWSVSGSSASYAVSSSGATITSVALAGSVYSFISTNTTYALDLYGVFSVSSASDTFGVAFCGSSSFSNGYRFVYNGSSLVFQKITLGIATTLASTSFSLSANTAYSLRLRVSNGLFLGKIWNGIEPASFTLITSDSTYTSAGNYGLFYQSALSTNTLTMTHFFVLDSLFSDKLLPYDGVLNFSRLSPLRQMFTSLGTRNNSCSWR